MVAFEFGFTVIMVVSVPPQLPGVVYEIVNVPTPATLGSNVPAAGLVIPVPDHMPPEGEALKLKGVPPSHTGLISVIVGLVAGLTVTVDTAVPVHPEEVPVTVNVLVESGDTVIGFDEEPVLQE
jgi:hypothetical protein